MHFPFAEDFGGLGTAVLGLLIVVTAFLMRRSGVRSKNTRNRDVAAEVKNELRLAEQKGRSDVDRLAVRLHDFARDVDALAQTRIATLRELTAAADRAIAGLETQLALQTPASDATRDFSATQRQMIALLADAGHPPATIATLLNRPEADVRRVVDSLDGTSHDSHAA